MPEDFCQFKEPKILVFRGGALGDLILTIPAIVSLRKHWPGAHIELAGYEKNALLLLVTGLVDRVQSLDSARIALYFQTECGLPEDESEYVRSFDLIVSYLHDPDGILVQHLKAAGAKKVIAASPIVKSRHASDHFFLALNDVLGDGGGKCPSTGLDWPAALKQAALQRLLPEVSGKRVIIIHPGSGSPAKNWPVENFLMLAKRIKRETDYEPLVMGGEADVSEITRIHQLSPDIHIIDNLSIVDAASVLSAAEGYVGNDSGLTHLAAALGIPATVIFGPTDPELWAPRGNNVAIIKLRLRSSGLPAVKEADVVFRMLIGQLRTRVGSSASSKTRKK